MSPPTKKTRYDPPPPEKKTNQTSAQISSKVTPLNRGQTFGQWRRFH